MGEAKNNREAAQELLERKAKAEAEARKAQEEFSKLLKTPMTEAEAEDALSRIDMQRAQLGVLRMQIVEQLNRVDAGLAQAEYDRSIVLHRALLGRKAAAGEGEAAPEAAPEAGNPADGGARG